MQKKIKIFLGIVVAATIFLGVSVYSILKESPTVKTSAEVILFYGRECPHCQDLEKFLDENKISDKIKYDTVEVWHNQDNDKVLMEKAKICGIKDEDLGVPFLWVEGKCLLGNEDIIKYFEEKLNEKK